MAKDLARLIGHYGARAIPIYLIGSVAVDIAAPRLAGSTALSTATSLALLASVMCNFAYHERQLCERCMAAMPLDGPERADRYDRTLRTVHKVWSHTKRTLLIMLGMALLTFFGGRLLDMSQYERTVAFGLLVCVPIALFLLAVDRHDKLRPWCPYCRWGWKPKPSPANS
jgi:hypothetical protein